MSLLLDKYGEILNVASLIQKNGWAEKNAGNFSIKLDFEDDRVSDVSIPLSTSFPMLSNSVFIVTGKGTRMRDIAKNPIENTLLIRISSSGDSYSIITDGDVIPTSELPTHLAIHNMIAKRGSSESAVIHSHVTELIALTHIREYCNQDKLNNLLWQMHPETIMFIPKGVGFVPFKLPGSNEIATATIETLKNHQIALWEKHGAFSIADNINNSYDLIDIIAKSAKIYFLCASTGTLPEGLSEKQLQELGKIDF